MIRAKNEAFDIGIFEKVSHGGLLFKEVAVFFGKEGYTYRQWFKDEEALEGFVDDLKNSGYHPPYFRRSIKWTKRIVGMIF